MELYNGCRKKERFHYFTVKNRGTSKRQRKRQQHVVWRHGFDLKVCRTEKFILQKLNYMHENPCAERWKLVDRPHDYKHSSASFYAVGKKYDPRLTDYRDMMHLLED